MYNVYLFNKSEIRLGSGTKLYTKTVYQGEWNLSDKVYFYEMKIKIILALKFYSYRFKVYSINSLETQLRLKTKLPTQLRILNQAKNILVVLPNSPVEIWGKSVKQTKIIYVEYTRKINKKEVKITKTKTSNRSQRYHNN